MFAEVSVMQNGKTRKRTGIYFKRVNITNSSNGQEYYIYQLLTRSTRKEFTVSKPLEITSKSLKIV